MMGEWQFVIQTMATLIVVVTILVVARDFALKWKSYKTRRDNENLVAFHREQAASLRAEIVNLKQKQQSLEIDLELERNKNGD